MTIEKFSVLLSKLSIYQQHVLRPSAFPMAMCLSLQLCYRKPHKLTWLKHSLLEILNPSAKAIEVLVMALRAVTSPPGALRPCNTSGWTKVRELVISSIVRMPTLFPEPG